MRLLKASIIVMGVLIVLGLAGLLYGVMTMGGSEADRQDTARGAPSQSEIDTVRLGLPDGTVIHRIEPNGETVILHLTIPGEGDWVYIVPIGSSGTIVRIAVTGAE